MPNIRTPGKSIIRSEVAPAPVAVEVRAGRRVTQSMVQAGRACLRVCTQIERFKLQGATTAAIEAVLGLDAGDLEAHFDACHLVASNAGLTPPAWS